jgi:hypothetical protein
VQEVRAHRLTFCISALAPAVVTAAMARFDAPDRAGRSSRTCGKAAERVERAALAYARCRMSDRDDTPDPLRVDIVDPSAFTPPYDHALSAALARAGAAVRLQTSRFAYAAAPEPQGYARVERFYRRGGGEAGSRRRFAAKLVQHAPNMLRGRGRRALPVADGPAARRPPAATRQAAGADGP